MRTPLLSAALAAACLAAAAVAPAQTVTPLTSGNQISLSVASGEMKYYSINAASNTTQLQVVQALASGSGDADLYVRKGSLPTTSLWDFRPYLSGSNETVTVTTSTTPPISSGTWYIAVRGYTAANVTLRATLTNNATPTPTPTPTATATPTPSPTPAGATPSSRGGMGPIPYSGGTAFRVWAPNATSVSVAGDFNGWNDSSLPLASEGNGNWSRDVAGATTGQRYKYVIRNGGNTLWKTDPRAKDVTNSVGESRIHDPNFEFGVSPGVQTLFTDNFEATTWNAAWARTGTGNWGVNLSTTYKAAGTRGATLSASASGAYQTSQLTMTVNAANWSNLNLQYKIRNVGDETHATDGVYISGNGGTSWSKINTFPAISSSWSTVNLNISSLAATAGITPGSNFKIRWQEYDDYMLASDGVAIDDVVLTGNAPPVNNWSMPAWNELVIYQMSIGTMNDSPGFGPGNFTSAIAKLDHLQSIGVNCVKLLPVNEFAGDFSMGYNPAHPFTVESSYGGYLGLKEFVKQAHARGIAVLLDVVYNHFGPSDLDMWQYDGWSQNGKGGIYFYNDWRSFTPWGDTRPDYGRGEVRAFLRDNALMWLEEYQLDGLRWDSTVNIRTQNNGGGGDIPDGWSLLQYINNEINSRVPWKISICEDLQNNEWMTKTTGAGGAGFDSQWDAQYVHPIRDELKKQNDGDRNMFTVRDAINARYNGDAFQRVIYTESHDEVRLGKARMPSEIWWDNPGSWASKKRSTLGAALTLTAPGIPMLFHGQEFLEDGTFEAEDPLDWSKNTTYSGIRDMYRDMIRLRRNWNNNTRGLRGQGCNVFHVNNTNKVIAFHRYDAGGAGDDVVVVMNWSSTGFSSYNIGFPRGGTWYVRFNSDWNGYSGDFSNWNAYNTTANSGAKDGLGFNGNVGIGPYTCIILSQ